MSDSEEDDDNGYDTLQLNSETMANGQHGIVCISIWLTLAVCFPVVESLTTKDFVPYGLENGDTRQRIRSMPYIEFDGGFRIGKHVWKRFQVKEDGQVTFKLDRVGHNVLPYFAFVNDKVWKDESGYGKVWYRLTREKTILSQLDTQIRAASSRYESFTAGLALVATWHNVTFDGANDDGKKKRNTFQAVVVGDVAATETFAIYNYAKLEWSTSIGVRFGADPSTGLGGNRHAYGRLNGYFLPGHRSEDVLHLTRTSNIGIAGRRIYKMSEATHFAQSGTEGFESCECSSLLQCIDYVKSACWCNPKIRNYEDRCRETLPTWSGKIERATSGNGEISYCAGDGKDVAVNMVARIRTANSRKPSSFKAVVILRPDITTTQPATTYEYSKEGLNHVYKFQLCLAKTRSFDVGCLFTDETGYSHFCVNKTRVEFVEAPFPPAVLVQYKSPDGTVHKDPESVPAGTRVVIRCKFNVSHIGIPNVYSIDNTNKKMSYGAKDVYGSFEITTEPLFESVNATCEALGHASGVQIKSPTRLIKVIVQKPYGSECSTAQECVDGFSCHAGKCNCQNLATNYHDIDTGSCEPKCPEGFSPRHTKCYKFHSVQKSHSEAGDFCTKIGGFLAEPMDDAENGDLNSIMTEHNVMSKDLVWIGAEANIDHVSGAFVWRNGEKTTDTDTHWAPGQPSSWEEIQHCLALELDKGWNDKTCYDELPFICQSKKGVKGTSHATGIAGRLRHASLVELLIGTILTWVCCLASDNHGQ